MATKIWFKAQGGKPEVIDTSDRDNSVESLLYNYRQAFGVCPGQARHGKDKVWAGRRKDEP